MKDCTRRENTAMRALYLLAIFFVVDGHLSGRDMLDLGGLFGYYSFHLMLFAFGSGYFFRDGAQDAPGREIARAAGRLLVPLYLWNLVYGVGARDLAERLERRDRRRRRIAAIRAKLGGGKAEEKKAV